MCWTTHWLTGSVLVRHRGAMTAASAPEKKEKKKKILKRSCGAVRYTVVKDSPSAGPAQTGVLLGRRRKEKQAQSWVIHECHGRPADGESPGRKRNPTQNPAGDWGSWVLAGWTGWGGRLLHPLVHYFICLKSVSLSVYLRRGTQQIPHPAPASHPSTMERGREESTACFAFSPLRRGVSHQLALDRPGSRGSRGQHQRGLWTPHMMD